MKSLLLLLTSLVATPLAAATLTIDGQVNEAAWQQAQRFDQFVAVEPYTETAPPYGQVVRLLALPEGLAVAFEIEQPAGVLRTKPQTQRDQVDQADRVNLIVDFDGKGQIGYNFTVTLANSIEDGVAARNFFRNDWDGDWQHAVQETEQGWSVEMLIPWTITPMDPAHGDTRTIGIYLDRVLKTRGERYAYPALRFSQSDFVSSFAKVVVPAYSASQNHVYPYVSVSHDNINNEVTTRAGLDLFYKPSTAFQLIGALNPDFGQVESDDLVVDFSAIEVYFSDKRPFFTENNDDFTFPMPDKGQLIYTRRIGGTRDDGVGVANIDAAIKMRGATGNAALSYLGAQEADYDADIGRRFQVLRPEYHIGTVQTGIIFMQTERPYLDREANVQGADILAPLSDTVRLTVQALQSDIQQGDTRTEDNGGWLTLDINPSVEFQHTFEAVNYGEDFVLSDMGYIQRSNLRQLAWQSRYVQTDLSPNLPVREIEWEGKVKPRQNQQGDDLGHMARLSTRFRGHEGDYTEFEYVYRQEGYDDLISRGNGNWLAPSADFITAYLVTARRGDSSWEIGYFQGHQGLEDPFDQIWLEHVHYFGNQLTVVAEALKIFASDWLIWQQDNEFARYERREYQLNFALNWFPAEHHELRLKAQWLALVADEGRHYLLTDEVMQPTGAAIDDLNINTFGMQARYRYQLGSLSDLFIVYSRGGYSESQTDPDAPADLFEEALSLRDADQFLVKLRLQF